MNVSQLLSGKFTPTKLPDICAPRRALINLIHDEEPRRIIYISAPAGYGKTVSTQLWLESTGRIPLWIDLDEYDNTLYIFYKLFCTGVLALQPDNKAMADIMASPSFASSPVEHTISLLSEFLADDKQYAVILDGMHLVTNEEIRKSGLLVQKRLPTSFVLLVLTRNEIDERFIAVTGEENCAVITADDLAFSMDEIQKYFHEYGRFITTEEAGAVYDITDGWAIGVNAMVMNEHMELGQSGGCVLGDYINAQIWDKWDDDLKEFTLKTSVVDTMNTELCVRLADCEYAGEILDGLCVQNAFVSKISDHTYKYHPLFLDFLRDMLEQSDVIPDHTLYKTASDYYLKEEEYFLARRYAIKSGDTEAIINTNLALFNRGKTVSIDQYVGFYRNILEDLIPEPICNQHPYIYATYVWYYLLIGNLHKMEYYLTLLYKYLPVIVQMYPQFIEHTVLLITTDPRVSFMEQMKQLHSLPIISNKNDQLQATSISLQLPYAHRTIRDYHEFADEKVMDMLADSITPLLKSQCGFVLLELRSGFLYERNRLKEALEIALQTRNVLSEKANDEVVFCSYTHLAGIYSAMGREDLYLDVVGQAQRYIEANGAHHFSHNLMAFKTKFLLFKGDKTAAREWLDNYFVIPTEHLELYKIFQHFTTARAYMVLAQPDHAMSYITKLKDLAADFRRPLDIAEADILQSALEWALGRKKEAAVTLETALTAMQKYSFVRIFADEGAAVLPILKKLALNLKKENYQGNLNAHYLNEVIVAAYEQSRRCKGIVSNIRIEKPIKLSKQQKLILMLMSKGYKNAEIVELINITKHTVKSHQAAAYVKLCVNNAMDAVVKAKELGLIE